MNRLTECLARFCRDNILREKWLIAPSLRVGYQWLDNVARGGQPVVNVRVRTLRALAFELAQPVLLERGLRFLSNREGVLLTGIIFSRLREGGRGYILSLEPEISLLQKIYSTLSDMRLAGLDQEKLPPELFEVEAKGRELSVILGGYLEELKKRRLADYTDILELGAGQAAKGRLASGRDFVVLLPEDMEFRAVEKAFLDSLPADRVKVLEVDRPAVAQPDTSGGLDDSRLLAWLLEPGKAPAPRGDSTVRIFRAVGEANEVQEVFRRCLAESYRLDEVEILHTDQSTYVPLVFETVQGFPSLVAERPEGLPVTFAEGIPARYSRPGRALSGWLAWVGQGYPQAGLARLIQDGVLTVPGAGAPGTGFYALAGLMRQPGIVSGRSRYLEKMDQWISSLELRLARLSELRDEEGEAGPGQAEKLREDLAGGRLLRSMAEGLLDISPGGEATDKEIIDCAQKFLAGFARTVSELDNFAKNALLERLEELKSWVTEQAGGLSFDLRRYLARLPVEVPVLGSGPLPGKIHVTHISSGGHSGRPVSFIIGLDDRRFPGGRFEDPILLDSERKKLSPELPTSSRRIDRSLEDFARCLARLRGTVILGFSCFDPLDEREIFPSPVLLAAWRIISGERDADQGRMLARLPSAVSFAPVDEKGACEESDWWLWRLCACRQPEGALESVGRRFPHLARGEQAEISRAGADFTVYDGLVPEAGADLDPARAQGPVMSVSRLETLGRCPLAYFFRFGLELEPPEEPIVDPSLWLDPLTAGSLLHKVFQEFIDGLLRKQQLPDNSPGQHKLIADLLDRELERCKDLYPPANESSYRRRSAELHQTAGVFLVEEARHCRSSRPAYLEAAIGIPPTGGGTLLDSQSAVSYFLPDGSGIKVRGRIDRIDRLSGSGEERYAIWDYKTGSSNRYSFSDPFKQGRVVQHEIYLAIVAERLKEKVGPHARCVKFGFFFPGRRDRGRRLFWSPDRLTEGGGIISGLCRIAASGAFPATDKDTDCQICQFQEICGDLKAVTQRSREKLENAENTILEPFRKLRLNG
ncbi:MAG TPA: PD-(D/E)XK nuclease family protein [archaeon]|nr:PD-(D/E)XK nuclease family protein [archaeon]